MTGADFKASISVVGACVVMKNLFVSIIIDVGLGLVAPGLALRMLPANGNRGASKPRRPTFPERKEMIARTLEVVLDTYIMCYHVALGVG